MVDPKVAGEILREHFKNVTPEEFRAWHDKYVLKGRGTLTPTTPPPASREFGKW